MKRIGLVALILFGLLAVFAGTASAMSLPGTHTKGVAAACDGSTLGVVFRLKDVPSGVGYLAVVNGAAQKSQSGTTDGSDQIVVDIPGVCPTVCGKSLDVDMSLSGDNGEDTPFLNVPISCVTAPTTTIPPVSTTTVQTSGSTVQAPTTTTAAQHATTSTTVQISGVTVQATTSAPGSSAAALGASTTRTAAARAVSGSSLPFTGGTALPLVAIGLAAIGAGTGLVVSGKRRAERRS